MKEEGLSTTITLNQSCKVHSLSPSVDKDSKKVYFAVPKRLVPYNPPKAHGFIPTALKITEQSKASIEIAQQIDSPNIYSE